MVFFLFLFTFVHLIFSGGGGILLHLISITYFRRLCVDECGDVGRES